MTEDPIIHKCATCI